MNTKKNITLIVDNIQVPVCDERNVLEVIRKAKIELPTFCYHSEMSVYGACRLCMVEIDGRGMQPACSIVPEEGMVIHTNTQPIRQMRKMIVELLLASHEGDCPTCVKGPHCQLQKLAQRMGITHVRFIRNKKSQPVDQSSPALIRDPNKCVLCGDCVRMCNEIQGVGAIDFAHRGSQVSVQPSFGKELNQVECIHCGQCSRVCPTGALSPKPYINEVWEALHDDNKKVVVQIAPAVRVALGESFGLEPGVITTGRMVAALRRMGFDKIYDTSFAADLTVVEEAEEFLTRLHSEERLPQFTSCCPAWVKFIEQYYPEFIGNLSTCASPQQMLGSLCKTSLFRDDNFDAKDIIMVAIMPCTAKKYEAQRTEFQKEYGPDVDFVITTQELALMIKEMGMNFNQLEQDSFDQPFGFHTGGGVIFGNSGGVTEAVLRYVHEKQNYGKSENYIYHSTRGNAEVREFHQLMGSKKISFAIVSGLKNAKKLLAQVKRGESLYHFIEVMACPGGCINGAGQPAPKDMLTKEKRTCGLYENDTMLQLHKSQENPYLTEAYKRILIKPGSDIAHKLVHTRYKSKKRIDLDQTTVQTLENQDKLQISICFGTSCLLRGAQQLYGGINQLLMDMDCSDQVHINATFCYEKCTKGPVIRVGNDVLEKCTLEKAVTLIKKRLS